MDLARLLAVCVIGALALGCKRSGAVLFGPDAANDAIGEWREITPPSAERARWADPNACDAASQICTYGAGAIALDPSNPSVIYLAIDSVGLFRSRDRGGSWEQLGTPDVDGIDDATTELDSVTGLAVDPRDPAHLYAVQGANAMASGFWISRDAGASWTRPAGFRSAEFRGATVPPIVASLDVDPADFDHVLIGYATAWAQTDRGSSGIAESADGGETWRIVVPAEEPWGVEPRSVHFLSDPEAGVGGPNVWLVASQIDGLWRTEDAGATWARVSELSARAGYAQILYAGGALYAGGTPYPQRSEDNGVTWTALALPSSGYHAIGTDGARLFAHTASFDAEPVPYSTSPADDGLAWTLDETTRTPGAPFAMELDPIGGILYSSNQSGGLWALPVR